PARVGVDQLCAGPFPRLRAGTVAVPQLYPRAVGGTGTGDVQALAERPDGAVRQDRPLLRVGAVADPPLHPGTVRGVRAGHVGTLPAEPGDRTGIAPAALGEHVHVVHD